MKILAIEAAAKCASVAIVEDGAVLAETFLNNGLTHSVTIMPSVEWLFEVCGIKPSEIERIAVSKGPGSFTGLRIAMAAVKGLAFALDIPCAAVSTLEVIAENAKGMSGTVCAVMDARAGQVYNALFAAENGELRRLCEDRAISIAELSSELSDKKDVILLGDGAELCYNKFTDVSARLAPPHLMLQRASNVALLAERAECVSASELRPEYLRLPQAERERLSRLNK